jgi:predicted metal-dependent phosphoesterase TrpH
MMYLYETHLHTAEVSRCASISAAEQVRYYKAMGFSGIIVTDHFLGGHTTVPDNLPWEQRVELFCSGYELAKEEGNRLALSVYFGWEYSYMGIDFLTYGLDQAWLLRNRDIDRLFINDYLDLVRGDGGYVVHAHPFREEAYIPMIQLMPRRVDAVEVCNACRTDFENRLAGDYAAAYGLKRSAGSDNHTGPQTRLCAISVKSKLKHLGDFIAAVQASAADIVSMPGEIQRSF